MGLGLITEQGQRRRSAGTALRRRPQPSFASPSATSRPFRNRLPSPRVLQIAPPSTWGETIERLQEEGELTLLCQVERLSELERYLVLRPDAIVAQVSDEILEELREAARTWGLPLVVLSEGEFTANELVSMSRGGAVIPKSSGSAEVAAAVRAAMSGLAVIDPRLLSGLPGPRPEPEDRVLSSREREVLQLIASGMPNKQIARALGISPHTAKFHVAGVLQKLGAASRTEAVSTGVKRGLVSL